MSPPQSPHFNPVPMAPLQDPSPPPLPPIMICNCSGSIYLVFQFVVDAKMHIPYPWYFYVSIAFELLIILVSCILCVAIFILSIRVKVLHENLRILFIFFFIIHIPGHISRLVSMSYEFFEDLKQGDCVVSLIITSVVQSLYMNLYIHFGLAIAVERIFANYFIKDYERKRRLFVPGIILPTVLVIAIVQTLADIYGWIPFEAKLGWIAGVAVITLVIYFVLVKQNRQVLDRLTGVASEYSLSVRFQANENLRVLRLCRNMLIAYTVISIVLCLVVYFMITGGFSRLLVTLFDLGKTSSPLIMSTSIILTVKQWRDRCLQVFPWFKTQKVSPVNNTRNEAEIYFGQLAASWNQPRS